MQIRDDKGASGNTPLSKAERDREDLNNEMAGREVGRQPRFLPEEARPKSAAKHREEDRAARTRLMILLSGAAYAALYTETMDKLRTAEVATEAALDEALEALEAAKADVRDALDGAGTLPDGTRVFRDAEGNAVTEHGEPVDPDKLDSIDWREGAIGYEDFLARKKALDEAEQAHTALLRYRTDVLGAARDRLADADDPPSPDELRDIKRDIMDQMPPTVRSFLPDAPEIGQTSLADSSHEISIPKI